VLSLLVDTKLGPLSDVEISEQPIAVKKAHNRRSPAEFRRASSLLSLIGAY